MNEARDEAVAAILTECPCLEAPVVECLDMLDDASSSVPDEVIRASLMGHIRSECADEIAKIRTDPAIKEFTESHVLALADFLIDGVQLFEPDERAAIALHHSTL
jgi:hypothetical protein